MVTVGAVNVFDVLLPLADITVGVDDPATVNVNPPELTPMVLPPRSMVLALKYPVRQRNDGLPKS